MIELNELLLLNDIIYKIHTKQSFDEMRQYVLEALNTLLKGDSATFFILDQLSGNKLGRSLFINCKEEMIHEYLDNYHDLDYAAGLFMTGKSMVFRESDIMSDDQRTKTEYYNMVYRINGYHHSIHLLLSYKNKFLGVLSFFRKKEKENFTRKDILYLEVLQEHLNYKTFMDLSLESQGKYTVENMINMYHLTSKESLVLESLVNGKNMEEISIYLGIAKTTVKKHLFNIYQKTGCSGQVMLLHKIKK